MTPVALRVNRLQLALRLSLSRRTTHHAFLLAEHKFRRLTTDIVINITFAAKSRLDPFNNSASPFIAK